ncbi:hypothetical protein K4L06_01320 [Lysobacter sp. BMK333-48F3]|uniref:hypothetical protein n=1 Tax=Lysobacter sp. BMK333-48F3 TaxID=2867962 RepID=UPI001C8B29D9|nr:hypothetical protein [Lysobacter sp. BMK333-48F3]MBX9399935.1 hypothetical protein [Lysobacter sp. BMK333-48F3]
MNNRPLPRVSADQIQTYLQMKNWVSDGAIGRVATVWHRNDSYDAEVVLPLSLKVKDYDQRLKDALVSLAAYEQREIIDVADDIVGAAVNLVAVRVIGQDTSDGSIPIDDGVLLIRKAKELFYAAAMAVYSKRRQFSGVPPKDAKEYMDSLLLGQTEIGSYVVKIIAPIHPIPASSDEGHSDSSLTELVAHSLVAGLSALTEASGRYQLSNDLGTFERAVALGASANMCDALLGFSGKDRTRGFEIKVSAPSGPLFVRDTKTFSFGSSDVETLELASSYYKNDYVLLNREIMGSVKHLHRPQVDEVGTITVQTVVGESERSVQIQLGPEDYHLGVLAHDRKLIVRCRGDVHVKSRTARLLNPRDFEIVELPTLL